MKMTPGHEKSRSRQGSAWVRVPLVLAAAATAVTLAGCGSSKPAYCTDRSNLQNAVNGLTSLTASSGVSAWESQAQKVHTAATALVNSAKSDFPSQTSAITSAVNGLKSSAAALRSSPSAATIVAVTQAASGVKSSVTSFKNATSSQCG